MLYCAYPVTWQTQNVLLQHIVPLQGVFLGESLSAVAASRPLNAEFGNPSADIFSPS